MKRLVVCTDGTWNSRNRDQPTNVEKIAQAIRPLASNGIPQVVFYDAGVGTNRGLARILGGALGMGLSENVGDAYRFLVDNYAPGDEIYLFGFSRGAFTARSTVGLIRKCGLLRKEHAHRFPEAYSLYRRHDDSADSHAALSFRSRFSEDVKVTCLGVWDTVGALGIPGHLGETWIGRFLNRNYQFHDVKVSSKTVKAAYQALAIDEEREAFSPAIWWREFVPTQVLEQAWFPGCHSDVGGGAVTREEGSSGTLSDVALEWMMERAQGHGLEFDSGYVREHVRPDPLAPIHHSRVGVFRLTRRQHRIIGELPPDQALWELIAERTLRNPDQDPLLVPPPIEAPQVIHTSARIRLAGDPSYRPPNLPIV